MGFDKRIVVALSVLGLILAPAAVLRAVCAGHSCDEPDRGAAAVPFCSLPDDRRAEMVAGFREGRSPDVLVVSDRARPGPVPLLFAGAGIDPDASPSEAGIDSIAPTIADVIGFERPHPEVRSGEPIPGIAAGDTPGVVILVVVKGLSATDLDAEKWPEVTALGRGGVVTTARLQSSPNDPTAVVTTIGTGGTPAQHGITGELVRNDTGKLVTAWGPGSPVSVIATLADDLDELEGGRPLIGLVAPSERDRGLVGGDWYVDNDKDVFRAARTPDAAAAEVQRLIEDGFGDDDVPDLLAVTLPGASPAADRAIGAIAGADPRAAVVVTGTGPVPSDNGDVVKEVERAIEGKALLIEGSVAGGFFVDQDALAQTGRTEDQVIDAISETGEFTDAFAAITVSFARYC